MEDMRLTSYEVATPLVPDYYPLASGGVAKMFVRFKLDKGDSKQGSESRLGLLRYMVWPAGLRMIRKICFIIQCHDHKNNEIMDGCSK